MAGSGAPKPIAPASTRSGEDIRRATDAIERATGARHTGHFCRGNTSAHTRRLFLNADYTHDSNALDDDLPYRCPDTRLLVLSYALDSNDMKFFHPNGFVQPENFSGYVAERSIS